MKSISRSALAAPLLLLLLVPLLLLAGCTGTSPAPSTPALNTSPDSNATARAERLAALQTQISALDEQIDQAQAYLGSAQDREDDAAIAQQIQALGILAQNRSALLNESCALAGRSCSDDLKASRQLAACADAYAKYDAALRPYQVADAALEVCQRNCTPRLVADPVCLMGCNPALSSVQTNCQALRPTLSAIKPACLQLLEDPLYARLNALDTACSLAAHSQPYSIPTVASNSSTSTSPSEDSGPALQGYAAIDPLNGTYQSKYCRISAKPAIILAGQETEINIYAYAGNHERITYTCGEGEPLSAGTGGLVGPKLRICPYRSVGPASVWVALDGYVCASAPLDVESANQPSLVPSCRIAPNTQSLNRSGTSTSYSAVVLLRHQPASAQVSWGCDSQTFSVNVSDYYSGSDINGALQVSCLFREWTPTNAPGRVHVGTQDCGAIGAE